VSNTHKTASAVFALARRGLLPLPCSARKSGRHPFPWPVQVLTKGIVRFSEWKYKYLAGYTTLVMRFRDIKKRLRSIFERRWNYEIEPDEIFLDSTNLPLFDKSQFEGQLEKPVSKFSLIALGVFFVFVSVAGIWRIWTLQVIEGSAYADLSENNHLKHSVIFASRGVIYDRSGMELAWNDQSPEEEFPKRRYAEVPGNAHVIGFVNYPQKDDTGVYFQDTFIGKDGVERELGERLSGQNGLKIIETDAKGVVQSESVLEPPKDGEDVTLSIDANINRKLYEILAATAKEQGYRGGAGAVIDILSGELLALTSYPEYLPSVLAEGKESALIDRYVNDSATPFLNRAVSGLYAPGSIVKPFVALGALDQGVIDPGKIIISTGSIKVPNPYAPGQYSIFKDWKALGPVDMRRAIAFSSDVYFYEIGGGFEGQRGLGIKNIEKYMKLFGIGEESGVNLPGEVGGTIPGPEWKAVEFPEDSTWRVGDTYNTAIGQYGFQVTPLQMLRGVAAIANDGNLLTPTILKIATSTPQTIPISQTYFEIVKEGMRMGVTEGTASGLSIPGFPVAAKTGTAQLGARNEYMNSWVMGFFPYREPRYAFVVVMDRAPAGTLVGGVYAARQFLLWLSVYAPDYLAESK